MLKEKEVTLSIGKKGTPGDEVQCMEDSYEASFYMYSSHSKVMISGTVKINELYGNIQISYDSEKKIRPFDILLIIFSNFEIMSIAMRLIENRPDYFYYCCGALPNTPLSKIIDMGNKTYVGSLADFYLINKQRTELYGDDCFVNLGGAIYKKIVYTDIYPTVNWQNINKTGRD